MIYVLLIRDFRSCSDCVSVEFLQKMELKVKRTAVCLNHVILFTTEEGCDHSLLLFFFFCANQTCCFTAIVSYHIFRGLF